MTERSLVNIDESNQSIDFDISESKYGGTLDQIAIKAKAYENRNESKTAYGAPD